MWVALLWVPLMVFLFTWAPQRLRAKRCLRGCSSAKAALATLGLFAVYRLHPGGLWLSPAAYQDGEEPTFELGPSSDLDLPNPPSHASLAASAASPSSSSAATASSASAAAAQPVPGPSDLIARSDKATDLTPGHPAQVPNCSPNAVVTPSDFGASGDGRRNDTDAVRAALAHVERCGGTLLFGPGPQHFAVWPGGLRASLRNVVLHFEGSLLGPSLPSWNPEHGSWPAGSCAYGDTSPQCHNTSGLGESPEFARSYWSLLHLVNSSNVTIRGDGTSGGLTAPGRTFWTVRNTKPEVRGYCLLKIDGCRDVRMSEVLLRNSPMYHVVIMRSSRVQLSQVRVQVDDMRLGENGPHNTDSISIIASSDISVTDSTLESGDDNIVIKESSQDIFVNDVILRRGKGLSIGSLGERASNRQVVSNILFSNISLYQSFYGARIKTWKGGSGLVQNVTFDSFLLDRVFTGFIVDQDYCPLSQRPEGCAELPNEQAIRLQDILFRSFRGSYTTQERSVACRHCWNVNFRDIELTWNADDHQRPQHGSASAAAWARMNARHSERDGAAATDSSAASSRHHHGPTHAPHHRHHHPPSPPTPPPRVPARPALPILPAPPPPPPHHGPSANLYHDRGRGRDRDQATTQLRHKVAKPPAQPPRHDV